jgi:hypothetical protein
MSRQCRSAWLDDPACTHSTMEATGARWKRSGTAIRNAIDLIVVGGLVVCGQ